MDELLDEGSHLFGLNMGSSNPVMLAQISSEISKKCLPMFRRPAQLPNPLFSPHDYNMSVKIIIKFILSVELNAKNTENFRTFPQGQIDACQLPEDWDELQQSTRHRSPALFPLKLAFECSEKRLLRRTWRFERRLIIGCQKGLFHSGEEVSPRCEQDPRGKREIRQNKQCV